MNEMWQSLTGWLCSAQNVYGIFLDNFLTGLAAGLLLALLALLLGLLIRRRNRGRGIMVSGDAGFLFVTPEAVREFVGRVLEEVGGVTLRAMELRQRGDDCEMTIGIQVSADADVRSLVDEIRIHIIRQAVAKLGLQKTLKVNVNIRGFERGLAGKRADKAGDIPKRNVMTGFPTLSGE